MELAGPPWRARPAARRPDTSRHPEKNVQSNRSYATSLNGRTAASARVRCPFGVRLPLFGAWTGATTDRPYIVMGANKHMWRPKEISQQR